MENFRLKVFRTVAHESSFRRAAERLHLSQPAVSQQVQALEAELGVALFDRGIGTAFAKSAPALFCRVRCCGLSSAPHRCS